MRRKGKRRPAMKPPCSTPEQTRILLVSRLMCKVLAGETISHTTLMPTYQVVRYRRIVGTRTRSRVRRGLKRRKGTSTMVRVMQIRRERQWQTQWKRHWQ